MKQQLLNLHVIDYHETMENIHHEKSQDELIKMIMNQNGIQ
jgi:hypothetical protein